MARTVLLCAVTVSIVLPKWTKHTKPNQLEIQWHQDSLISISASLKNFAKGCNCFILEAFPAWPSLECYSSSQGSDNQFRAITIWAASPAKADAKFSWPGHKYPRFVDSVWFSGKKGGQKNGCMHGACPRKHLKIRHQKRSKSIPASDLEFSLTLTKKTNIETREKRDAETRNLALPKALLSPVHFRSCVPTKIKGRSKTPPLWQLSRMQVKRHPAGKGRTKVWNSLSGTRRRLPGRCFFTCHFRDGSRVERSLRNSCCQTQGGKRIWTLPWIMPQKNINTTRLHALVQLPLQQQGTRYPKASLQSPYRPKWCKSRFATLGLLPQIIT